MKAVGIVSEYNPLHNGHLYHIAESKRLSGAQLVISAMSGNFVQRGEPAIMDKWVRARHALECGVDVVLEIPTYYALGNASIYGSSGVRLLEALGVSYISFGSESGDIDLINKVASNLRDNHDEIETGIRALIKSGLSYPSAREKLYYDLFSDSDTIEDEIKLLNSPNDILALEYVMNIQKSVAVPVKRRGAMHDDMSAAEEPATGITDDDFVSAGYIRSLLSRHVKGEKGCKDALDVASGYIPYDVREDYEAGRIHPLSDKWFETIRYKLLSAKPESFNNAPGGGEGIENRLIEAARNSSNIDELILSAKTKRYTYTRISRLLMQLLLDIDRDDYPEHPPYVRILGFTERGREYLSMVKKEDLSDMPIITNVNKEQERLGEAGLKTLELDIHAADIYHLTNGIDIYEYSDKKMIPIMVDNH